MKSKKGMDAIVTTVIMVALALIAIGIIWAVISNLISNRAGDIDVQSKCLGVQLEIPHAVCYTGSCIANVTKKSGDKISGVRLAIVSFANDSNLSSSEADIPVGATESRNLTMGGISSGLKGDITAAAYFLVAGKPSYCQTKATYKIA